MKYTKPKNITINIKVKSKRNSTDNTKNNNKKKEEVERRRKKKEEINNHQGSSSIAWILHDTVLHGWRIRIAKYLSPKERNQIFVR